MIKNILKFDIKNNLCNKSSILIYGNKKVGKTILSKNIISKSKINSGHIYTNYDYATIKEFKSMKNIMEIKINEINNDKRLLYNINDDLFKNKKQKFILLDDINYSSCNLKNKIMLNIQNNYQKDNYMPIITTSKITNIEKSIISKFDNIFIFRDNNKRIYDYLYDSFSMQNLKYDDYLYIIEKFTSYKEFKCLVIDNRLSKFNMSPNFYWYSVDNIII